MQIWEYETLIFVDKAMGKKDSDKNTPSSFIVKQVNEKKVARFHYTDKDRLYWDYDGGEPLHKYLNRAGQEGWKVVSVAGANIILLERPIEE